MKMSSSTAFLIFSAVLSGCSGGSAVGGDRVDRASVRRGGQVWEAEECAACHGDDGRGTLIGPSLEGVHEHWTPDRLFEFLRDPGPELASNPRLGALTSRYEVDMPGVRDATEDETRDLAAFVLHGIR